MTDSTPRRAGPLVVGSPPWRARAESQQDAVVPRGAVTVACPAAPGAGGLGRHLEEIVAALQRAGGMPTCICESPDGAGGLGRARAHPARLLKPLTRLSPPWRLWRVSVEFDAAAAASLAPGPGHVIGFNGTSLALLRAARAAGAESTVLVSANPHTDQHVARQEVAFADYPIERPWASRVRARTLREYELADRIYVSSEYIRESFQARGFPDDQLAFFPLTPHPRFRPEQPAGPGGEDAVSSASAGVPIAPPSSRFEIVYSGSLLVDKGVPLLIDAVRRLPYDDLRLTLVGGWKTRGMREFVQRAQATDKRIEVGAGDPLPALQRASVCVHVAYQDGFAYAPAEALACGVPVIVSEDTGMKDLIASRSDGQVLPTGDLDALTEALEAAYRGGLFAGG